MEIKATTTIWRLNSIGLDAPGDGIPLDRPASSWRGVMYHPMFPHPFWANGSSRDEVLARLTEHAQNWMREFKARAAWGSLTHEEMTFSIPDDVL